MHKGWDMKWSPGTVSFPPRRFGSTAWPVEPSYVLPAPNTPLLRSPVQRSLP